MSQQIAEESWARDAEARLFHGIQAVGDSVVQRLEKHVSAVVEATCGRHGPDKRSDQGAEDGTLSPSLIENFDRMIAEAMLPVMEAQRRIEKALVDQQYAFNGGMLDNSKSLSAAKSYDSELVTEPAAERNGEVSAPLNGTADQSAAPAVAGGGVQGNGDASQEDGPHKSMSATWSGAKISQHLRARFHALEEREKVIANAWHVRMQSRFQRFREQALEKEAPTSCFGKFILGSKFEFLCTMVILLNGVFGWYAADQERISIGEPPSPHIQSIERCFLGFYVIEITVKIVVHKHHFFFNADMYWNLFDTTLVMQALYDELAAKFLDTQGQSLSFMRLLRLLKLGKVFRMLRALKAVRELRTMLRSVIESIMSMFWCMTMFMFFLYIFALIFLQGIVGALQAEVDDPGLSEDDLLNLDMYFGSVSGTMLTLYMATSGGADWEGFYDIIGVAGIMYQVIFLVYLVFTTFALLNILTGMLVEKVSSQSVGDRDDLVLEWRRKKNSEVEDIKTLCHEMDVNANGLISWAELEQQLQSESAMAFLESLGLKISDAHMFFSILQNVSGKPEVDIDMFVEGCMKMKGLASGMDQHALSYQIKTLMDRQTDFDSLVTRCMNNIQRQLAASRLLGTCHTEQHGTGSNVLGADLPPLPLLEDQNPWIGGGGEDPAKARL